MRHLKLIGFIVIIFNYITIAQNKFSAEFKPNINFPTENFSEYQVKTGNGFEISLGHTLYKKVNGYIGWSWNLFNIDSETKKELEIKGYSFGFQLISPINEHSKLAYLLRFGGFYNKINIEVVNNGRPLEISYKPGVEFAIGLDYCFLFNWTLRPQLSYRSLSFTNKALESNKKTALNYMNIGLGLSTTF